MAFEIQEVNGYRALKKYIDLPAQLYRYHQNWVPPMYTDEWNFHSLEKNPSWQSADVIRFLAFRDGQAVGRIMGIIHHAYNASKNEKTARFFNFDCIDDQSVAQKLIHTIEQWALTRGMKKLIGPYGFSDKDPQGLQIEGFEYLPVIGTPSHPPYLPSLLVAMGWRKEIDCVSYTFPIPAELPPLYQKIAKRFHESSRIRVVEFKKKKELRPYILPVLRLVNETYQPLFGFIAMSEREMKKFADQYMPVLDPELVKVVVDEQNNVLAFVVALAEMSKGIQKAKGKIFPFGFIYILNAARHTHQLNLMLGAVKPGFRGIGLNVLLAQSLFKSALTKGFTTIDSHLILETNDLMKAECERLGGKIYKRYRVFQKSLI